MVMARCNAGPLPVYNTNIADIAGTTPALTWMSACSVLDASCCCCCWRCGSGALEPARCPFRRLEGAAVPVLSSERAADEAEGPPVCASPRSQGGSSLAASSSIRAASSGPAHAAGLDNPAI